MSIFNISRYKKRVKAFLITTLLLGTGVVQAQIVIEGNVYGGGKLGIISDNTSVTINQGTTKGNVFGGGMGADTSKVAGLVQGNVTIDMNNGIVEGNIYGGGEMACVGEVENDGTLLNGRTTINLFGGAVGKAEFYPHPSDDELDEDPDRGHIYGGGKGDGENESLKTFCNVNYAKVNLVGGTVYGSVYGGSAFGHVLGNDSIFLTGTTVGTNGLTGFDGSVFGGGKGSGYFTYSSPTDSTFNMYRTCGRVAGNNYVKMESGIVKGSVYGGGRLALTGVDEDGEPSFRDPLDPTRYDSINHGLALIDVRGSSVIGIDNYRDLLDCFYSVGDIFGGGQGDLDYYDVEEAGCVANAIVNVAGNATIYCTVFGGGEIGGVGYLDNTNKFIKGTGASRDTIAGTVTIGSEGEFSSEYQLSDEPSEWTIFETVNNVRRLQHTCSGNVFGASQGDASPNYPNWIHLGRSRTSEVVVKDNPTIRGSVFGGAEQGTVTEDTYVKIMGGTIGTLNVTADSLSTHTTSLYNYGSVFGGGYGVDSLQVGANNNDSLKFPNYIAGRVYGNTYVHVSAGTIRGNLYGGGNLASVGIENGDTRANGKCFVTVSGGTIGELDGTGVNANVFGGGRGFPVDSEQTRNPYANVNSTEVTIRGGAIKGDVFGGGAYSHVLDSTDVFITGNALIGTDGFGRYDGSVFGGGRGNLYNFAAGRVAGNTHVVMDNGHVLGNVYGGGLVGLTGVGVNGGFDSFIEAQVYDSLNHGLTMVEVSGGTIGNDRNDGKDLLGSNMETGNVYGGGRGNIDDFREDDYGRAANAVVKITGNPNIYGSVFGGGQMANVGHWNNYVSWYTTRTGATCVTIQDTPNIGTEAEFTNTDYLQNPGRYTYYDTIYYVEYPADTTCLRILSHTRTGNVYGGGQGKVAVDEDGHAVGLEQGHCRQTYVNISGTPVIMSSVFGGSEEGAVWGGTEVNIAGGTIGREDIIPDSLNYDNGIWTSTIPSVFRYNFGNVFGGSYGKDYYTQMDPNNATPAAIDSINNVSGRVYGNTLVNITNGSIKGNVFGGGELASVGNYTEEGALVEGSGLAKVIVNGGTVGVETSDLAGNVYGGGLGKPTDATHDYSKSGNVDSTRVEISNGYIVNSVFGGAKVGHVKGNTDVVVSGGLVGRRLIFRERYVSDRSVSLGEVNHGDVYGGGEGSNTTDGSFETFGRVYGNTNVTVNGNAVVRHNVYGGGRMASVGDFTYNMDGTINAWNGGGLATVTIGGNALIGPKKADLTEGISDEELLNAAQVLTPGTSTPLDLVQYRDVAFKYLGSNEGSVYGSGRGRAKPLYNKLAYVRETSVNIEGDAQVVSCVFGGGENGRVYEDTEVTIDTVGGKNSLVIGGLPLHGESYALSQVPTTNEYHDEGITLTLASGDSEVAEDELGVGRRVLRGQVFGGGRGTDTYPHPNPHVPVPLYNPVGGRVYGNAKVTVNGGTIYNNVYGGGTISSVGTFTYQHLSSGNDSVVGYVSNTGKSEVVVNGGQIGTDGRNNGNVYGGGLGSAVPPGTQLTYLSYVGESYVTVNGGQIKSNVYGGAANGHVQGDAHVVIDETDATNHPTVIGIQGQGGWHSNVYGGGGGTNRYDISGGKKHLSISSGRVFGDTEVEIKGGHVLHNVYGGGAIASVGTYNLSGSGDPYPGYETGHGKSTVTVTGGTIGYNGDNNGMVFGSCRGEIDSIGAFLDSLSFSAYTEVNIGEVGEAGPTIKGSVYGGGENGHVYIQSLVNVNSGTIGFSEVEYDTTTNVTERDRLFPYRGNVYGGGCGTDKFDTDDDGVGDTYNPMSGIVYGDAVVNINGGYISRNVYGAGAMASVGYYLATEPVERHTGDTLSWPVQLNFAMGGTTEVNINGGHIGTVALAEEPLVTGCVYGASRGDVGDRYEMAKLANVKRAFVTVDFDTPENNSFDDNTADVIVGSVFGGGESGHVYDTTSVTVEGGLIVGSVFGAGEGSQTYKDLLWNPATEQPFADSTMVCDIIAGKVFGNTSVTVNGGRILRNVYGGGNMASVGKSNYIIYGEGGNIDSTMTTGRSHVRIYGGIIGTNGIENGHVFGSSRGLTFPSINKTPRYRYSRDFFLGYVNQAFVTIGENVVATPSSSSPRIYGSVFGGGQNGHVRLNTEVVINDAEIGVQYDPNDGNITDAKWLYRGNVYGAGRGTDLIPDSTDRYCSSAGSVTRNTHVIVNGGLIHRDVYGGGSLATVGPPALPEYLAYDPSLTTVDIIGGTIGDRTGVYHQYGGNVYGSSRGLISSPTHPDLNTMATVKEAVVNIGAKTGGVLSGNGLVNASVYGSGENGHVTTNATVNIYGGRIGDNSDENAKANEYCGNVYGAGSGTDMYDSDDDDTPDAYNPMAGVVKGNTTINVEGGWVMRNIYGGGEMASVGTLENDTTQAQYQHTDPETQFALSWPYEFICKEGTGKATVNIYGGRIGITGKDSDKDNGDVYGGGKGFAGPRYQEAHFANVDTAVININYGTLTVDPTNYKTDPSADKGCITGAVYGGGENGHVNSNTYITLTKGLVGHAIYGAGKGKGKYTPEGSAEKVYSLTAGKVFGDTYITLNAADNTDAYVVRSIFGGGNLASVGKGNYIGLGENYSTAADSTLAAQSGRSYIYVYGGTLGMLNPSDPSKAFKDGIPYGSVFGGSRGQVVDAAAATDDLFGFVNNSYVTIGESGNPSSAPRLYGSVYGGAQDGHIRHNTYVTVNSGEIGVAYVDGSTALDTMGDNDLTSIYWTERGNVFGGGSGIGQYDENVSGTYNKFAGSVMDTAWVEIKGGRIHRNVYGGGNLATSNSDPYVHITETAKVGLEDDITDFVYGGDVFGAGKGFASGDFKNFCNVPNTHVLVDGGNVYGDVYGGGENGHVIYNTNVNITTGASIGVDATSTFDGNVFGGGWGSGDMVKFDPVHYPDSLEFRIFKDCGRVGGNTNVTMDGGTIQGTIFGGGRVALVGVNENGDPYLTGADYDSVAHGLATITVTGGSIGNSDGETLLKGSDETVGDIFGSGKGDVKNYEDVLAGRVGNTRINISGSTRIYGSVFGGGEMAGIGYWDEDAKFYGNSGFAKVTIEGTPVIGTVLEFRHDYATNDPSEWTVYDADGILIHTCTGNVYGGSQGDVDPESGHWVSMARSRTAKVTINGNPTIMSRVFGGAEQGSVAGDTKVTINGGTIGSWANIDDSDDSNDYLFGGVYGGGFGSFNPDFNDPANENDSTSALSDNLWTANYLAGRTYGDVRVDLLGGLIQGDVYGGSEFAYIGGYGNNPKGKAKLYIGNQDQVGHPDEGVTIIGNVYGANNFGGSPLDSVQVHIFHTKHTEDDLVDSPAKKFALHNVFGGGNESDYTPNQGLRDAYPRSALVHVYNCENTIEDLYGGGNAADIGTTDANADANIIVDGGRLRRVFGGGKGDNAQHVSANIYGTAHTQVLGGIIETVYGGGNQQGSILYTDLIVDNAGDCDMEIDSIFGGSNEADIVGDLNTTIACSEGVYENIYGGANNANVNGSVTLNILGSTIENAFGGSKGSASTSANINGNVTLNIFGGNINNAFGGSDMNGNITGVVTVNVIDTLTGCDLNLINVYGGSKTTALTANGEVTASPVVNIINGTVKGDVFGGSLGETATTTSNPEVNIGYNAATMSSLLPANITTPVDTVKGNVYGGGSLASTVGNTTVNIYRGVVGDISYDKTTGSAVFDTIIHVNDKGRVFGGGKGRAENIATDYNIAMVTGDTRVNIKGGKVLYSVYGGGELSSVSDSAIVTVTGGQVGPAPRVGSGYNIPVGLDGIDGYVFGGGKGIGDDPITNENPYGAYYRYANVNNTLVTVNIPAGADTTTNRLWGSVFGGAEDGHVLGNANVRYESGTMGTMGTTSYDGNIFGGGRNYSKRNYTAGRVGGDIKVEMSGGQLFGNIYGGGRLALTGIDEKGEQAPGEGHGNVKVVVKGGKIGNERLMETFTRYAMGDVYGGGKGDMKGLNGSPSASSLLISLTRNTEVIIKDSINGDDLVSRPVIYGCVYGGGEVANVGYYDWDTIINPKTGNVDIANIQFKPGHGHAKVVVSGGQIGADRMKMRYELADGTYDLKYNDDVGHVFGGGAGIVDNPANYDTINPKAEVAPPPTPSSLVPADPDDPNDVFYYKPLIDLMATVVSSEVIISDSAWVKGSVYGGGANGHVAYNTSVKVQGGQIGSGDMPVERKYTEAEFATADSLTECPHWPYGIDGNFYPYDPLYVKEGKLPSDGKSWFGNVFGGGSGFYPYIVRNASDTADSTVWNRESGKVYGKAYVEITGGHILTNVYGGCETTDVMDSAIVVMRDGTLGVPRRLAQINRHPVTCYLFGAGKGDPRTNFNTWTNVVNARVDVSGGWIYGSVFGGGEEGHVLKDVKIDISGDAKIGTFGYSYVDGNVFGAGRGFSGEALTAGTVGGNVDINIAGGEMLGSIYGGGRLASVGTEFTSPTLPNGDPNPHYGHMQDGPDHGIVTIDISGGVIGNDYEAIHHTDFTKRYIGGNVFSGSMGRITLLNGDVNTIWPNLAKVKKTTLTVRGDAVIKGSVYGGGEFGTVDEDATINIQNGTIWRDVYGGGFGSSDITSIGELGIIEEVSGELVEKIVDVTPMEWAGRVKGNAKINISGGWIKKSVYGGGELASVGTIDSIAKHPEHPEGAVIDTTFNLSWPYFFSYATHTGADTINVTGGRIGITGKDYMGPWNEDGNPYSLLDNHVLTSAEIKNARQDNGDIYGGGKGIVGDRFETAQSANANNTVININYVAGDATPENYKDTTAANRKGCITGAVYGGGENGHVNNDTRITLTNGLVGHAVYGGGKGKDTYDTLIWKTGTPHTEPADSLVTLYCLTAGKVYGNTYININGGYVVRSVFGGGNLASVGKGNYAGGVGDYNPLGYGEVIIDPDDWTIAQNSGHTYVNIIGGVLGRLDSDPNEVFKDNVPYGSVFGGCRGMAVEGEWDNFGFVNYTHVQIGTPGAATGPRLYGSVFGGSQDGHVRWNTNTVVNSGEIGVDYGGSETSLVGDGTDVNSKYWVARGNVYGGGSGIGMYDSDGDENADSYSHISGSVLKSANVTINGGTIHRNVYGGGNLASVGPPRYGEHDCDSSRSLVTVNINSEIGQNTNPGYGGYVFGGSKGSSNPDGENFPYKDFAYTSHTRVNLNDRAHVYNDVFGGGENGQVGTPHVGDTLHTSVININDGAQIDGSVFGGGQGVWGSEGYLNDTISGRVMGSTRVNLNNSQVAGNIYGGGALGVVMDSAVVVIAGGQVHDVFGASKGYDTKDRKGNADVTTATRVNIEGGTVHGSVYGGGEFGSVGFLASEDATVTTNVNLNGGHLEHSAYGGGKNGFSRGGTFMNVSGTCVVDENVFGGAYGRIDTVFVAGLRTVNMRGGTVRGSVYGGSYNANDALVFTPRPFNENDTIEPACLVNYSGGQTERNVFGAGYFGKTFGSTYVFIGERAISSAPNHSAMVAPYNEAFFHDHKDLVIMRDIWSGADFGTVEPGSGSTFGGPTITGRSDIYIDGFGYDTRNVVSQGDNSFMDIGENVFGCGTLNDGGRTGKIIMMRNYGYDVASGESDPEPWATATRDMNSIQQADSLIIESSHIKLAGRGIVTVVSTTSEPYTIFDIKHTVRVVNGSSLYIDKPIENIGNLYSVVGSDLYDNPTYVPVNYNKLVPVDPDPQDERYDNKFRINQGTHVSVNMSNDDSKSVYTYGALIGYFHMMTDGEYNAFAYARPKNSTVTGNNVYTQHDNPDDGGFVSYRGSEFNIYSITGDTIVGPFVQMPYENHTPAQTRNGESYYRVWRYFQSALSILDVQLIAVAQDGDGFHAYQPIRQVQLPPGNIGDYYKLKENSGVVSINYGSEIKTVNAGVKDAIATNWMYSDGIDYHYVSSGDGNLTSGKNFMKIHPNNAFGLTMIPVGGFVPVDDPKLGDTVLICTEANTPLINSRWNIVQSNLPSFDFRLTHYNKITGNFQWDPISIFLEHYNSSNELIGEVEIKVTITTKTLINQDNDVDTYALMVHSQSAQGEGDGDHHDVYSARVLMPSYEPYASETSTWTLKDVKWYPNTSEGFNASTLVAGDPYDYTQIHYPDSTTSNFVGMTLYPTTNYDNSNGWVYMTPDTLDLGYLKVGGGHSITDPIDLGIVDPRKPFSLQFDLHYDSKQNVGEEGNDTIGRIELTAHFTNYQTVEGSDVKFNVYVHRRGKGRGFYIDGQHGEFVYSGHYPNAAQPSLAGIFYFTDFEPSDTIYIVDKVVANAVDNLSWDGREYNQVNIFRYNGGHPLCKEGPGTHYEEYDTENNPAYKGVLVDVLSSMSINSIILDGACLKQELKGDPSIDLDTVATNLISNAPMIRIHNGAELTIFGGEDTYTSLNNNYNAGSDGGAVDITVGGTLNMGQNAFMNGNYVKDGLSEEHHGGAIHMDEYAVLLLSDSVMINTNNHVNATDTVSENVYISHYNTVIHVGTAAAGDEFGPLNPGSRIGVTKTAWNDMDYMPVVFTENNSHGDNLVTIGNYAPGQIIYDELHQYGLVEYPNREANEDPYCLSKLYFAKTWVNQVTLIPEGFNAGNIDTPEELAWAISVVNGYNGQTAAPATNFTLTKDVDMSRYIWVPIGDTANNYRGTFNGDGYLVSGIRSALSIPDKGVFGSTNGATIKNLQARVDLFTRGKVDYLGGIVGVMNGGVLSNVESAGYLQGGSNTKAIGGLVGKAVSGTQRTIHSSFALDTIRKATKSTWIGGLVGDNACDLYNSYSNVILDDAIVADTIGGLVGVNRAGSHVENCYSVVDNVIYSIVYKNEADAGYIKDCYSNTNNYYCNGTAPQGHGTYSEVLGRKDFGYMYKDNLVTLEEGESDNNVYYSSDTSYVNNHIYFWPGLLSTLNKWVSRSATAASLTDVAPWYRPTTEKINNDLPVLAFKTDSAIAVVDDIAFLRYSKDFDFLLDTTNKLDAQSSMFLYGIATEVENVPDAEVNVFLNEDAVLMQKAGSADFNNTTTGITFDNSWRQAHDAFQNTLKYDWHLLSSPLRNAKTGINYTDEAQNYWHVGDDGQIDPDLGVVNSYMPNRVDTLPDATVKWDYYTYYEPEYHWINFKRNSLSHHHYDYPYAFIEYNNEDTLVPAKGYMMAISEDSYLSNTGTLNRGKVTIPVTAEAPDDEAGIPSYNKGSNLVGNPYQAYLDLDEVAKGNIFNYKDGSAADTLKYFYIYSAEEGVYAPYMPEVSKNPRIPSRYIHPHQGFFVLFKPAKDTTKSMDMTITQAMAGTVKNEYSYFRGDDEQVNYPLVNLIVQNEGGERDLAIVELARPTLDGVEKVENLQNSNFKLYTHMGDKNYSLLFTPIGTKKVPLFFKTPENGNYTLTWDTHNGTFKKMLLIDNITGAEYNMLTGNSYSFTGHATDYAARFYIVFELDNPVNIDADDEDFAFFDGTQWVIKGDGQLELIDVTGRVLHSYSMNSRHNHVSFDHVAAGTYLLRLVKDRNNVKTQKIVIY